MSIVSDYLKSLPPEQKDALQSVCSTITEVAPEAIEATSYGMPGYYYNDKYLVTFGAFRDHLSIFPGSGAIAALKDKLEGFTTSKGTVQFTPEKPLPKSLLVALINHRLDEIKESSK